MCARTLWIAAHRAATGKMLVLGALHAHQAKPQPSMTRFLLTLSLALSLLAMWCPQPGLAESPQFEDPRFEQLRASRQRYRQALNTLRAERGEQFFLPRVDFFLFGMGDRKKFLYVDGSLREAITGAPIDQWSVEEAIIVPDLYTVALKTDRGLVIISEDSEGVWLERGGERQALSRSRISLPDFKGRRLPELLKVLHQEVLINILDGAPVPNLMAYPKPWYRDAAMAAMVLKETDNVGLIRDWVLKLSQPYDRMNQEQAEADNLGEALYLISLVSDANHPLVQPILKELALHRRMGYVAGLTDFEQHPVYQTQWAKFGLRALKLPDPYTIPGMNDPYGTLAWWGQLPRNAHTMNIILSTSYPYLTWAGSHLTGKNYGAMSDRDYPLSWEANGGMANMDAMGRISKSYITNQVVAPHTWTASEMFMWLYPQMG